MDKDETKKAAEVMLAWADGAVIQYRDRYGHADWCDVNPDDYDGLHWNWMTDEYRIKPEPREFWLDPKNGCWYGPEPTEVYPHWVRVREVIE